MNGNTHTSEVLFLDARRVARTEVNGGLFGLHVAVYRENHDQTQRSKINKADSER